MDLLPQDKQVVDLLSKLKQSNGNYPVEMLASRRQQYIRQVANAGLGIGVGTVLAKGGKIPPGGTITSKILETVLIAAITIEAGAVAYIYRAKIKDFINANINKPGVVQTTAQPEKPQDTNSQQNPGNLPVSSQAPTATSGATETPSPEIINNNSGNNNTNNNTSASATPNPAGENGNQFGQTPKPERTKENNGNNNNGSNSNGGTNNGGGNNDGGNNNGGGNNDGGNNNGNGNK